jgi:hypothetical protein
MHKTFFIVFLFLGLSTSAFSQYDGFGTDEISRFRPGSMWFFTGFRPAETEKVRKYDRLIFDLTYNDWSGDLDPFKNKWNSIGLNTSLMFDFPITKGNTVSFGTGLSHSLFRINNSGIIFSPDSSESFTTMDFEINNNNTPPERFLCGNSISVPLEFRFRTKGWKHFKFHLGGKIGYQLNMYSKTVSEGTNGRMILKDHNFADAQRLIYSAHFRIGIRNWALFGSYNLNSLFSNDSSPKLNLLQMGLSISLF